VDQGERFLQIHHLFTPLFTPARFGGDKKLQKSLRHKHNRIAAELCPL